jgi:hypothetical protein
MITNKEELAPGQEAAPEEEVSQERSSAPTVLDLRAALKDLFMNIEAESDPTSPDARFPQKPD